MQSPFTKNCFKYPLCQGGGLHEGEILNLVCADNSCMHRGMICPICKLETHEGHYTLSIKSFLIQVQQFCNSFEQHQVLDNLHYLLRLTESTKKGFFRQLKDLIQLFALYFKQLEENIENHYLFVRRNIMTQASSSKKFSSIIEMLLNSTQDPFGFPNKFNKLCQLIAFQNGNLKTTAVAPEIVTLYEQIQKQISKQLTEISQSFKKNMHKCFKKLETNSLNHYMKNTIDKLGTSLIKNHCIYNINNFQIKINSLPNNLIYLENPSQKLILINANEANERKQIIFQILKFGNIKKILVGIGNSDQLKQRTLKRKHSHLYFENSLNNNQEITIIEKGSLVFEKSSQQQNPMNLSVNMRDLIEIKLNTQSLNLVISNLTHFNKQQIALKNQILQYLDVAIYIRITEQPSLSKQT